MENYRRVWKIGTRWGNTGPSNLDLFLNYQCAFFGLDGSGYGDYTKAKEGDLLLVCSGAKPVAIGIMKSEFFPYEESGITFCERDRNDWIGEDDVVICKARFCMIPQDEKVKNWGNDSRRRFCSHSTIPIVNKKWEEYNNDVSKGSFDIKSRTVELLASDTSSGVFSDKIRYRIPVYQRPYSWGESELRRLVEDLKEGVVNKEPMFLGTMQLSAPIPLYSGNQPECYAFDIIDGQQRTTTLMLLRCLLEERLGEILNEDGRDRNFITHVNRGSAQRDLDEFWKTWKEKKLGDCKMDTVSANPYLANIANLNNLLDDYFLNSENEESNIGLSCLLDYINTSLRFVVIETHAGISKTLKIFNTINTTGLDLGSDDLFKIRLYEYRKDVCHDSDDIFDDISKVYERIANAQKDYTGGLYYSMSDVLDVYKRILIAKYQLRNDLDALSTSRFFERLFDSVLHVRKWPEFKDENVDMQIADLNTIVDTFEIIAKELRENQNLHIMHRFLFETRYGYAWNYLAVALYFKSIAPNEMLDFDTLLFKLLVPPSLHWAKRVSAVQGQLLNILRALPTRKGVELLRERLEHGLDNQSGQDSFTEACNYPISGYIKWKNLICRLCEYLISQDENTPQTYANLFEKSIDIEHIQSYTDSKDRDATWNIWGDEINRLGNLVIFESSLNRSVGNDTTKKPEKYASSVFRSVNKLKDEVEAWTLEKALERRKLLTQLMREYLFTK